MFRRLITTTAALLATGLVLTGCGAANAGSTSTPDTSKPLRIMATCESPVEWWGFGDRRGLIV